MSMNRRKWLGLMAAGTAAAACQEQAHARDVRGRGTQASAGGAPAATDASPPADPAAAPKPRVYEGRPGDGRFTSPAGQMHAYLKGLRPRLAFDPRMAPGEFPAWRQAVVERLRQLLGLGEAAAAPPAAKRLSSERREGYRLEKWEAYPEPRGVATLLALVPEGAGPQSPAPAVLCTPGTSGSKESLAGEPERGGGPSGHRYASENAMALHFVRKGFVAVALDSFGWGETADPLHPDPTQLAMAGLWVGRPYEGLSVAYSQCVLGWLRQQPEVDPRRIATSGHSLGAKPALHLGLLEPTVAAVIWNDCCHRWQSAAVATSLQMHSLLQHVPGMLAWFDYPDLMAAMAPRPLLISEGGRGEVLQHVHAAYELVGAADRLRVSHYPKYAAADQRTLDNVPIPEGITYDEYLPYVNCDPPEHYFKHQVAVPWLAEVLAEAGGPQSPS